MSADKRRKPKTLKQYIKLCERCGEVTIKRKDGVKVACSASEVDRFIKKALGGRTQVPLRDLIPWMRRDHSDWETLMEVVDSVLINIGVLPTGYEYDDYFAEPSKSRASAY
jgi:hypothetical protein